jgi:hypothetical protein
VADPAGVHTLADGADVPGHPAAWHVRRPDIEVLEPPPAAQRGTVRRRRRPRPPPAPAPRPGPAAGPPAAPPDRRPASPVPPAHPTTLPNPLRTCEAGHQPPTSSRVEVNPSGRRVRLSRRVRR